MKLGAIVLTVIPQGDQQKKRPVLILKTLPKYNDFLVCAISSQLRQFIPDFDLIIKDNHPEFSGTGLRTFSLIRLANLAVLSKRDIIGTIGYLPKDIHKKLLKTLADFLLAG